MAFVNNYPALAIPDCSLGDLVLEHAYARGDTLAILDLDSGRGYTYRALAELVEGVATFLVGRGLAAGEYVALMLPNVPEFPVVFHAILRAGGVVTTLNPLSTAHEIAFQLQDCGARFLVAGPATETTARAAGAQAGLESVWIIGEPGAPGALDQLLAEPRELPGIDNPATALAALPYSSGTTGLPKGVMLSHRNLVANVLQTGASQAVSNDDVLAGILPFFHIYGMTVIMNLALWRGATIVSITKFSVETMIRAIEHHRVTRLYAAPPIVGALTADPTVRRADLSSLEFIMSGAAPLGGELARRCQARTGCRVVQGYGLTETSPCTHLTSDAAVNIPQESVGPALPDTEVRVIDVATCEDLGPEQQGELWIRGPQVMRGYLNNPEATTAAIDSSGWFRTGDIVRIDQDGNCYVVDRLKELIKHKGFQVSPAELEAVLNTHEAVADAAVIGVPDLLAGEVPKAFVVAREGCSPTGDELKEFVASLVAPYKRLGEIEFVSAIPRTASGKIQRRLLRTQVDHNVGAGIVNEAR